MSRVEHLELARVEYMPAELARGVLYYSERWHIAIHLCACGCGQQTVTPLDSETGWTIATRRIDPFVTVVTLRPSIGNMRLPCGSHYYVTDGRVEWL